jgi:hypothetical protein
VIARPQDAAERRQVTVMAKLCAGHASRSRTKVRVVLGETVLTGPMDA